MNDHSEATKTDLESLRYFILPSANPPSHLVEVHNAIYETWTEIWTNTFRALALDPAVLKDEFVRQDFVTSIMQGMQPVTVHLYSFFAIDCKAARNHSYLSGNYPEIYFQKVRELGVRNVMSMEYMTVHPDWRRARYPVLAGGLALQVMKLFGAEAAIAPARRDHKVHELAPMFGGESLISRVMNHNVECDLLLCRRSTMKPHADPAIQLAVETLWDTRVQAQSCEPQWNVIEFPVRKRAA